MSGTYDRFRIKLNALNWVDEILCPDSMFIPSGRGRGFDRRDRSEFNGNSLMFASETAGVSVIECNWTKDILVVFI